VRLSGHDLQNGTKLCKVRGHIRMDGRIILKWILKTLFVTWIEIFWLRT